MKYYSYIMRVKSDINEIEPATLCVCRGSEKVHDRYKRFIAYKKGYEYIAIPYWTNDKNETWKILIENKIELLK